MKKILKQLIESTFWITIGEGFGQMALFLSTVFVAKILAPNEFGDFGIVRSTIYMFLAFSAVKLEMVGVKFVAENLHKNKRKCESYIVHIIWISFSLACIFSAFLYFSSDFISNSLFNKKELASLLRISSFIIFCATIRSILGGIIQGLGEYKLAGKSAIISSFIGFIAIVGLAYYFGIVGVFVGYLVHRGFYMFSNLVVFWKLWTKYDLSLGSLDTEESLFPLLRFVLPTYLTGLMILPLKWVLDALLVRVENGSYYLGLITAALTLRFIGVFPIGKLEYPLLSMLSKNKGKNKNDHINKLSLGISFWISVPVFSTFMYLPEIGSIFFSKEYANNNFKIYLIIISLYTMLSFISKGVERSLISETRTWQNTFGHAVFGCSLILSSMSLIPVFGGLGYTLSYLFAHVLMILIKVMLAINKNVLELDDILSSRNLKLLILVILGSIISILSLEILYLRMVFAIISLLIFCIINIDYVKLIHKKIKGSNFKTRFINNS